MEFVSTAEQEQLRGTVRDWLGRTSSEAQVRESMESESGLNAAAWKELATSIGGQGLLVDETYGGGGAGMADMAVVLEEMGRSLYGGPFLSTAVLGATALGLADDAALRTTYLSRLAAGDLIVGTALAVSRDEQPLLEVSTGADGAAELSGPVGKVLEGAAADVLLVTVRAAGDAALYLVDAAAPGVTRSPLTTMDQTRRLAGVELDRAPATPVSRDHAVLDRVAQLGWVALANEQLGGAQRCVDLAVGHARTRKQFGVPIGTFQAVKHACADMLAAVELARTVAGHAAWCADHDPGDLPTMARVAAALCSETYSRVAAATIQIHGGTGFTWDHPAHLYFKRAKSSELLFGQPAEHRDALGRLLGLDESGVDHHREEQPA